MRGRKRKPGKRKNGRLVQLRLVKGNDRAEARKARFGTNAADQIGRAYEAGLLGSNGKTLLDTARRLHNAWWSVYGVGRVRCAIGDHYGSGPGPSYETREWVDCCMETVKAHVPLAPFSELVIEKYPDHGPAWVDRLLVTRNPDDMARLKLAVAGLRALT